MKKWQRFVFLWASFFAIVFLAACGGDPPPPTTGSVSGLLISPGTIGGPGSTSNSAGLKIDTGLRNDLHSNEPVKVVPGEVFVTFNAGLAPQSVKALSVGGVGLQRVKTLALPDAPLGLYRAGGLTQAQTLALVADLRARPDVASAFPNWILHSLKTPNKNEDLDEGEPFGFYEDFVPVTAGRNIGGVTIYLQPLTPSAQGNEMMKLLPELEPAYPDPTPSNSKSVEERVN